MTDDFFEGVSQNIAPIVPQVVQHKVTLAEICASKFAES
jgi:hypothetical protein